MDDIELIEDTAVEKRSSKDALKTVKKLEPGESHSVSYFLYPKTPGKYTVQAKFIYNEGEPLIQETCTTVGNKIEASFKIGVVIVAYALTRLSLHFILSDTV